LAIVLTNRKRGLGSSQTLATHFGDMAAWQLAILLGWIAPEGKNLWVVLEQVKLEDRCSFSPFTSHSLSGFLPRKNQQDSCYLIIISKNL
jgi:hypothetical protein